MEEKRDYLITNLNIDSRTKEILMSAGYVTVGDLMSEKEETLKKIFDSKSLIIPGKYYGNKAFINLKTELHRNIGVTFDNEFEDIGIPREIALVKVETLALPQAIKNALYRQYNAFTFGDLLSIEYEDLLKTKYIGATRLEILKKYVHSLGYSFKNEGSISKGVLDKLKQTGAESLEEGVTDDDLRSMLYECGIYTIDDLNNFGPEALQKELLTKLEKIGKARELGGKTTISHDSMVDGIVDGCPTDADIEQISEENRTIKERIVHKEKLLTEYNRLIAEKKQLLARERELDELILSKIGEINDYSAAVYVKK